MEGGKRSVVPVPGPSTPGPLGVPREWVYHGKAPFPHYLYPMFPAHEHGDPVIFYRLSRVVNTHQSLLLSLFPWSLKNYVLL